jgi:hypothetical protein
MVRPQYRCYVYGQSAYLVVLALLMMELIRLQAPN